MVVSVRRPADRHVNTTVAPLMSSGATVSRETEPALRMNQRVPHQRVIQVIQGALGLCGNGQQGGLRHSRNDVDVDEPRESPRHRE